MNNQRGTTLVELLIYIGIVGIILTTVSMFILNLLTIRVKTTAMSQIVANARLIQDRLTDAIRHSEGINLGASTFSADPGVLSLNMVTAGDDPEVFSLTANDGQFQINKGGAGNVILTSDSVQVTNLVFNNLTTVDDVGVVQVQMTLKTVNPASNNLFNYEESFQTTLRIPLDTE